MGKKMLHRGIPIAKLVDGEIVVYTESCCYDYKSDTLSPEEAISLGSLLVSLGKISLQKREEEND